MGSIITRFAETAALLLMPVMTALAQIEEVATTDSIGIGRVRLGNANLACNFQRLAWLNRQVYPHGRETPLKGSADAGNGKNKPPNPPSERSNRAFTRRPHSNLQNQTGLRDVRLAQLAPGRIWLFLYYFFSER